MNALKFFGLVGLLIILDLPWLTFTQPFVSKMIRKIQGGEDAVFRIGAAVIVYIALAYLALLPETANDAFLLGASVYAVYDFTNYATLKDYDLRFAIADTLWGGVLFTAVFYAARFLKLKQ